MEKTALVSVIIVTYKQMVTMFETIHSVLMQDYKTIELIISDDGTPGFDESSVRKYISKYAKSNIVSLKVLHRDKNEGTVKNINKALECANGYYIKLIGGDDNYYADSTFTAQVNILQRNQDALCVIGKTMQCDCQMNPIRDERIERSNDNLHKVLLMTYDEARRYIAKQDIFPIAVQAICFRKEFFKKYGKCNEEYVVLDDSLTVLNVLKDNPHNAYCDFFCVKHRSKGGISSSKEMFSTRRIVYYDDCLKYAINEIRPNPQVYGILESYEAPRVSAFVLKMAKAKRDKKKALIWPLMCIMYFDSILYYSITNSKKLCSRIKERLSA